MSIFATRIDRADQEGTALVREQLWSGKGSLKRVLGLGQLTMLGVGAIMGTGIFVLTGKAAAANAGPAIVISMMLAGLTSVVAALC
jgi:basic amino acid/polyamine antiporter, APA family